MKLGGTGACAKLGDGYATAASVKERRREEHRDPRKEHLGEPIKNVKPGLKGDGQTRSRKQFQKELLELAKKVAADDLRAWRENIFEAGGAAGLRYDEQHELKFDALEQAHDKAEATEEKEKLQEEMDQNM